MHDDTAIGGSHERFPATRRSAIQGVRSADPSLRALAFEALVEGYWKPIYKYLRLRWRMSNEEAKDLTQGFLARALEKGWFERYDAAQASFRTYLRTCLDAYVANEREAGQRLKRGGDRTFLPLDFEGAEGELARAEPADAADPEATFHREWVRSLFELAVERLREECAGAGKQDHFRLFERYDLGADAQGSKPTYAELATELGLPLTQVTNHLAFARRSFRRIVLEELRALTGDDEEFRAEARLLFGGDPS